MHVQVIEDDPEYWEGISSALSVGWLEVVVSYLTFTFYPFICCFAETGDILKYTGLIKIINIYII